MRLPARKHPVSQRESHVHSVWQPVANLVAEHAALVATKLDIATKTPRVTHRRRLLNTLDLMLLAKLRGSDFQSFEIVAEEVEV
jgi:hypothetical protein